MHNYLHLTISLKSICALIVRQGGVQVKAKLLPGSVYYIGVRAASNASHYALSTPVSFALAISGS
jgi:hypothetical protein